MQLKIELPHFCTVPYASELYMHKQQLAMSSDCQEKLAEHLGVKLYYHEYACMHNRKLHGILTEENESCIAI